MLDETLLPWKLQYIPVTEVAGAVRAVKEMKTRAFGQVLTFLYAAALVARENGGGAFEPLREKLTELAERFTEARPTFGFRGILQRLLDRCEEGPPSGEVRKWAEEKIHEFIAAIVAGRERRARFAAELLPNPCQLMTHCNISGELVAVAQHCRALGKDLRVIATETRPYLQGSRLTAWEVARAGIQVAVIPDCAIAQVMSGGGVNAVLVGSDRNARNGDVINKVGTYPLALMAKEYGVPFYALVQDPGPLATGEEVTIEERPVHEFLNFQGHSLAPHVTKGRYPSFDITPARLISYLVGFDNALTPEDFRKKF
ncbi:MAG: hypothetical protein QF619_13480, partial [Candidatus Binatia bacterium]|nr:hypothetical protein [Candidatus Binatia bacterium]